MELKRERYLKIIRPFYNTDLIKIITGPRRSGKSVLLNTIKDEILKDYANGSHIISFNFEDIDFEFITEAKELCDEIKSRISDDEKYYIFLDEIQHINSFEKALASIRSTCNCSVFVTGSVSKLLASDAATLLTGRTVEFTIFPFSFKEACDYMDLKEIKFDVNSFFIDYIKWGGFPLRFDFVGEEPVKRYIQNIYTNVIERDILKGRKIDKAAFLDISSYILANAGKEFSATNILKYYSTHKKTKVPSEKTIYNYIDSLKRAYLITMCPKYNTVGKEVLVKNEKMYAIDTGFRTLNANTINYEDTFYLENIVYNELITRGYTVYTGKTYKGEVDFVVIKNNKKCFIQVSYYLTSEQTIKREFGAFRDITDSSPKYVMSLDKVDVSHDGIAHINIIDFLLEKTDIALT